MRAAALAVLIFAASLKCASAAPLELTPGTWEFTTLLRNFSISADDKGETESGGSGPTREHGCVTEHLLTIPSLYPGLRNSTKANRCKFAIISETSTLIDFVAECLAPGASPPYIADTIVTAPTPKSFNIIRETTFLEKNQDGSMSRSTQYRYGRWLKVGCKK